jgi:hypothetical protein
MIELLLFLLASIGLCHILVDSYLIAPVKNALRARGWHRLVTMLNCYQCAGFWSGVVVGLISLLAVWAPYLHLLLYGLAVSFVGPLAAIVMGYLNALTSAASSPATASEHQPESRSDDEAAAFGARNGAEYLADSNQHVKPTSIAGAI